MMRFPSLVIALALLPVTADGALTLRVEDVTVCPGETAFAEVYLEETPPAQDEQLWVYAVWIGIMGDPGVGFGPAKSVGKTVEYPFVPIPWLVIHPVEVTERLIEVVASPAIGILEGVDVTDGAGVLRIPITAAPGMPAGEAPLVFDLDLPPGEYGTDFRNEIGDEVPVALRNGTITVCLEPSAVALVLFGAALVTLRRQRQRAGRAEELSAEQVPTREVECAAPSSFSSSH